MSRRRQIGVGSGGDSRNPSADAYIAVSNPPARSTRPSDVRELGSSSTTTTSGGIKAFQARA
jgi:hypothetical protein